MSGLLEKSMEDLILDIAEHLFLENGFESTSTTLIARKVGCNQALIHYYFRTKDNLFNRIFETRFKEFFLKILEIPENNELTFNEKISHIAGVHYDFLTENPKLPLLLLKELIRKKDNINLISENLQQFPIKILETLNNDLKKEIEAGKVRQINLSDLIFTIVSLNVSMFSFFPIAAEILHYDKEQFQNMLIHRKNENIQVIMNYLRP